MREVATTHQTALRLRALIMGHADRFASRGIRLLMRFIFFHQKTPMQIVTFINRSKRKVCPKTSLKSLKVEAHRRHRRKNRVLLARDGEDYLPRISPEMTHYDL